MKQKSDSAPIQLLQLIWDNALRVTGDSWRRLNESLQGGLALAIRSGMKFGPNDFTLIEERYRPEYWMRLGSDGGEGWFADAVVNDNISAAVAFENWKDREPFIWNGIRTPDGTTFEGFRRLFVGAWFTWNGEHVSLTKFDDDKDSVRACSYVQEKGKPWHWCRSKILHRYVIKRDELLAVRKVAVDEKKMAAVDKKKLDDDKYVSALFGHLVGRDRAAQLRKAGAVLAFWRSDSQGRPCNGGGGDPRRVGTIDEEKGPLNPCGPGALHGTLRPDDWNGERLWAVALHPPVAEVGVGKYASLKREILAEVGSLPPYKELLGIAQASTRG